MTNFLEVLVVGIGNGAVYAMLGLGLVVIYRSTGLLNFAQGELAMFSTFIVWTIWNSAGVPMWLAILGGMAGGFLVGCPAAPGGGVAPIGDPHEKPLAVVIVTIGLFLALNGAAQLIWGTVDKRLPTAVRQRQVTIGGVAIQWQKIGSLVVLAAAGAGVPACCSSAPSSASACVQLRPTPSPQGCAAFRYHGSSCSAGVWPQRPVPSPACSPRPSLGLGTNMMQLTLVFGFAAITLGGFDSIIGAVVGGLIVGILSSVIPQYVSVFERMPLAPAFILILAVLLFRPAGAVRVQAGPARMTSDRPRVRPVCARRGLRRAPDSASVSCSRRSGSTSSSPGCASRWQRRV